MTRFALITLSLLCLSAAPLPSSDQSTPAPAAVPPAATVDVSIQGPDTASGGFALVGSSDAADAVLRWRVESPDGAADPLRLRDEGGSPVLVFMSPVNGRYRVVLTAQVPADGLDPFGETVHVVAVGKVPPPPDPDVDPDDDDTDPPPTPDDAAPFPADGLHVLIVYESEDTAKLTDDQREIIAGATTRASLNSIAPRQYRFYDPDADLQFVAPAWKAAMAVPRDSLPWLVVSNGKTGFSGPLDMSPADFLSIVGKHK